MLGLVIVVVLGSTVLVGTTLGGRYRVAPPVLLICLGGLLGLAPGLSAVELDPDVVLLLFLPAILYWESLNTSLREIRANLRVIVLSSVVLVIVDDGGRVAHRARRSGMDPRAAWVLGAVLAPTDAAAVAGLAKRLPRRTLTTLRAESLINDGTALVLFAVAVGRGGGRCRPGRSSSRAASWVPTRGGIAAGLLASGRRRPVRATARRPAAGGRAERADAVPRLPARRGRARQRRGRGRRRRARAHLRRAARHPRPVAGRRRFAFWDLATFMINGGLFVLVGLQFPRVVEGLDGKTLRSARCGSRSPSRPSSSVPACCGRTPPRSSSARSTAGRCSGRAGWDGASAWSAAGPGSAARCRWPPRSPCRRPSPAVRRSPTAT